MLKIKSIFISLFVTFLTISFNSCSDDESVDDYSSNIIGTWVFKRCYGWEYEYDGNGNRYKENFDEQASRLVTFTFNEDGTGVRTEYYAYTLEYPFEYSISGNRIVFKGIFTSKDDVTITKLTKNYLELKVIDSVSVENHIFNK